MQKIVYLISKPGTNYLDKSKIKLITNLIYDLKGNYVKSLTRKSMSTGRHSIQWDATNEFGDDVSTGIYFYTIKTEYSSETKKMLFLKW